MLSVTITLFLDDLKQDKVLNEKLNELIIYGNDGPTGKDLLMMLNGNSYKVSQVEITKFKIHNN